VVTVETDAGLTGIGEGGSKDMLETMRGRLIGKDPQYVEKLWQDMSRAFFYPPGREKIDALGALDLALWDIKGKLQKLPVHEILGGMVRITANATTPLSDPRHPAGHEYQRACTRHNRGRLPRVPHGRSVYYAQHHLQYARKTQPGS